MAHHHDHDNHDSEPAFHLPRRPRRNRVTAAMRNLMRETELSPSDFILPLFIIDGTDLQEPIESMPGVSRLTPDRAVACAQEAQSLGIGAVALFPALPDSLKDKHATESKNAEGLLQRTIQKLKDEVPDVLVITDVAMDPYSSDGHDGLVEDGKILNDPTLEILAEMAISHAQAGADLVAPSDMMDGRVGVIRTALDDCGFTDTGILAYSAKYASAFYGPFRDALDSAPKSGDKKTYQMDPANRREAILEVQLDIEEGADIVMVKPALAYLDVIAEVRSVAEVPLAAYQVSGEYAMMKAAAAQGWLDEAAIFRETLTAIKRAGADMILTYAAPVVARELNG